MVFRLRGDGIKYSNPPRNNKWIDYHASMTCKFNYFARGEFISPFYFNDWNEAPDDDSEILNCNWYPKVWSAVPYKYLFLGGHKYEYYAHPLTLKANHYSYKPAGIKKDGQWIEKQYDNNYYSFFWTSEGFCIMRMASIFNRSVKGWSRVDPDGEKFLKSPPNEHIIQIIHGMKAKKWEGFYQDVINFLMDEGIDPREV